MSEDYKICPYTGLRPFSEDESLYFKGRDEHIEQATRQLEKNKFLILTGASGDGKSSLVYAGIVPNARAGFLKSSFSNWAIADFRPERSPFHNLCKSIANQLGIAQVETVKAELGHGFSALVDLYKASSLYYNENESAWQQADDKSRIVVKRKAANLLILADQFEEFFTNPENYHKGVPSGEASLVTNLLLETAQLALEENLPIYVVITMRSDFIGQCAAFRGLPEYIGFSQFFVPRLNRKQLQEVIEEPANLNGDKISRRLTERLIHDMVEGTDQLPILQHALNQIWKMAADGEEELDLVHYAMVGGMEGNALPAQDIQRFNKWFEDLPSKIKECYDHPGLQNVLNTHANKLFNQAIDYVKEKYGQTISDGDAKLIIETTFRCLTKIDNGRAVRNRMSLAEITTILNQPHLDFSVVGRVLNIFREAGNTLLKPYMDEHAESLELKKETVLDITHESLIRNWEHLGEWAKEEYGNYATFLDFEQQLYRWVSSGKSNSFLLYIGPLTYFESWFIRVSPNAAWIARYLKDEETDDLKTNKARTILENSREFLHRSARKHWVTRTVMRYGPRRIAAVIGLIGVLVLSSFTVKNYFERRDAFVLAQMKDKILTLAGSPKVSLASKFNPLILEMELGQTTLQEAVSRIQDPYEQMNVATGVASSLVFNARSARQGAKEINDCLAIADSLLARYSVPPTELTGLTKLLVENNDLLAALKLEYYYNRDEVVHSLIAKGAQRSGALALYILKKQPAGFNATTELNTALENGLNERAYSVQEVKTLLGSISPFENQSGSDWLHKTYDRKKVEGRGAFPVYGPRFNGLYQQLAYLYASLGDTDNALKCIDTLLYYNQNYHQNNYADIPDNAANVSAIFYRYNHPNENGAFVKGYCKKKNISEKEFYERLIARSMVGHLATAALEIDFRFTNMYHNTNLEYGTDGQLKFFFDALRQAVNNSGGSQDARNFDMALSYKNETLLYAKRLIDAGLKPDSVLLNSGFGTAMNFYRKVSQAHLNQPLEILSNFFPRKATNATLFLFPDFNTAFIPWEPRGNQTIYSSTAFLDFILNHGLFHEFISGKDNAKSFELWISEAERCIGLAAFFGTSDPDPAVLTQLAAQLEKGGYGIDKNMLNLHLANRLMDAGNVDGAVKEFRKIELKSMHEFMKANITPGPAFYAIAKAVGSLILADQGEEARLLIGSFPSPANKAILYAYAAKTIAYQRPTSPLIQPLLDSSRAEIGRDEGQNQLTRVQMAYALSGRGRHNDLDEAKAIMKNVNGKNQGYQKICRSLSYRGELYEALKFIPENISDENQADFLYDIFLGRLWASRVDSPFWKRYESGRFIWFEESLFYDRN